MQREFYRSYLEAIPLPAVLVDSRARIIGGNAAAVKLNPHADGDRPLILVFRQPSLNTAVEDCLREGEAQRAIYLHSEGPQEHRYDVTCSPVTLTPDDSGPRGLRLPQGGQSFKGVLICFQDVTEMQQLDQMRRDFVANVSHELRTPLTAILGFVETLQGPARADPKAQDRFLGIMSAEASRMNRLVGDLLSLSRVEEVSRMRPTDPVDLDQVVRSVLQNLGPMAEDNDCALIYERERDPAVVAGDADQLLQVVTNLVENALKYGGNGTQVTVTLKERSNSNGVMGPGFALAVKDDGPGIDSVHIARLTERFYRIDSHRSREMGGTGLGLAIVKHIINRHRGRLQIDSVVGKGSVFKVLLPLR
ncbi:two-component sensor histidine kinase [Shimia sp. R9_1]|uniref:sensor histidine kinase n=1 Tax=unclassified Shimia TaxID=2630038 RepID=UPI001ADBD541|nr:MULTISPECIES: ATP-binding protein [unclassified Shimia]MBO9397025.1 two-component sensor histidine kinase [Shimia sp. R9_2]MBO9408257.1 two-component sensor histidine kinase [Shimia sp. R9_1]